MKTLIEYDISRFTGIVFIILVFLILILLKIIKIILPRVMKKSYGGNVTMRHYSTFEILVWLIFLFWSLPFFYKRNLFYAAGISLFIAFIIGFVSWYALRDIVAGFVVRANTSVYPGGKILFEEKIITITKLNANSIEGRMENGDIIHIPYTKLAGKNIEQVVENELVYSKTTEHRIKKSGDLSNIKERLTSFLIAQPGLDLNHDIELIRIAEDKESVTFRITYYAVDSESVIDIEKALEDEFGLA